MLGYVKQLTQRLWMLDYEASHTEVVDARLCEASHTEVVDARL